MHPITDEEWGSGASSSATQTARWSKSSATADARGLAVRSDRPPAFLGVFAETGVVDDWGREFAGRSAIRGWSDAEFIGKQVTLAVVGVEHDGARTAVAAEVGGHGFNGPSHFGFDLDGSTITRMTIRA